MSLTLLVYALTLLNGQRMIYNKFYDLWIFHNTEQAGQNFNPYSEITASVVTKLCFSQAMDLYTFAAPDFISNNTMRLIFCGF